MNGSWRLLSASCFVVIAGGCSPSPQPLPPPIDIDAQALSAVDEGNGTITVSGAPGALTNATTVEVGNYTLGVTPVFVDVPVNADGTFSVQFDGELDASFRFVAFNETDKTDPVDLFGQLDGTFVEPTRIDCAVATPSAELVLDPADGMNVERGTITVDNQCAFVLSMDEQLLAEDTGWLVMLQMGAIPTDIPIGTSRTFDIERDVGISAAKNLMGVQLLGQAQQELRLFTLRAP